MDSSPVAGGQCILVVDDEEDIRDTVKDLIETSVDGTRVRTARSGRAGLEVLREEKGAVRLIISDYRMPGMDGVSFLDEAGKVAPGVPSFLVTAYEGDQRLHDAEAQGRLVHKPFEADEFLGRVESALAR